MNEEAKAIVTDFMEAYIQQPMKRAEMSKLYKNFIFKSVHPVKDYSIGNFKKISDKEIHANIETTVNNNGQEETKLLRLILEKEEQAWKITDSKGIGNLMKSYVKEFSFGIKAGCFTKNIETLSDQQFLGKIKRSNSLLTQLAQKESGSIASTLAVENFNWKPGKDIVTGNFTNKSEYSFREVGFLVRYFDRQKNEIGMYNDILNPVKRGQPFSSKVNTPFSNRLPQPIPVKAKDVEIQFFINPNEISDNLIKVPLNGNECAGIK